MGSIRIGLGIPLNTRDPSRGDMRKHMSTTDYDKVLNRVYRLSSAERLRLLEDLASLVHRKVLPQPRSVLDLQGLGKEIWSDIDAQEYVDKERAAWNG